MVMSIGMDIFDSFFYDIIDIEILYGYKWQHLILFMLAFGVIILFYYCFIKCDSKKKQLFKPRSWSINTENYKSKSEQFSWMNKLICWLFYSSSCKLPAAIETWIHDLNMTISTKVSKFSLLVYGLKSGCSFPTVVELKSLKAVGHEIHSDVLLSLNQFGFLIAVQEHAIESNKASSTNYSATITHSICWCSAILTRLRGNVGLIIKPIEKNPECQFKVKAISKSTISNIDAEMIARLIRDAITETTFYANLSELSSRETLSKNFSDKEPHCYGDSNQDEFKQRFLNTADLNRFFPSSGSSFPPRMSAYSTNQHVTPTIDLHSLRRPRNSLLAPPTVRKCAGEREPTRFSTLSRMKRAKSEDDKCLVVKDALDCRGSVLIDPVNIRETLQLAIPLKNGRDVGQLLLQVSVVESCSGSVVDTGKSPRVLLAQNKRGPEKEKLKQSEKGRSTIPIEVSQPSRKIYSTPPLFRRSSSYIVTSKSLLMSRDKPQQPPTGKTPIGSCDPVSATPLQLHGVHKLLEEKSKCKNEEPKNKFGPLNPPGVVLKSPRKAVKRKKADFFPDNAILDSADCGTGSYPNPSKSLDSLFADSFLFPDPEDNPAKPSPELMSLAATPPVYTPLHPSPEKISVALPVTDPFKHPSDPTAISPQRNSGKASENDEKPHNPENRRRKRTSEYRNELRRISLTPASRSRPNFYNRMVASGSLDSSTGKPKPYKGSNEKIGRFKKGPIVSGPTSNKKPPSNRTPSKSRPCPDPFLVEDHPFRIPSPRKGGIMTKFFARLSKTHKIESTLSDNHFKSNPTSTQRNFHRSVVGSNPVRGKGLLISDVKNQ